MHKTIGRHEETVDRSLLTKRCGSASCKVFSVVSRRSYDANAINCLTCQTTVRREDGSTIIKSSAFHRLSQPHSPSLHLSSSSPFSTPTASSGKPFFFLRLADVGLLSGPPSPFGSTDSAGLSEHVRSPSYRRLPIRCPHPTPNRSLSMARSSSTILLTAAFRSGDLLTIDWTLQIAGQTAFSCIQISRC